ncbi:MAG: hypothetical protein N3F09_03950 [Bacteroidia bacterium]|nr:hypothetical protein [Bacteroidia bacterium]
MAKKKYLLSGIDYTPSGKEALKFAYEYCKLAGCGLEVFHLFDFPVMYSNSGLYFIDYREIRKNDEEKLKAEVFKTIPKDGTVDIRFRSSFLSFRAFTDDIKNNLSRYLALVLGYHSRKGIFDRFNKSSGVRLSGDLDLPLFIVKDSDIFHTPEQDFNAVILVDNKRLIRKSLIGKADALLSPLKMKIELIHIHTDDEWPDIYEYNYTKDFKKWNVTEIRARDFDSGLRKLSLDKKPEVVAVFSEKHSGLYKMFRQTHTEKVASKIKHVLLSIQN